MSSTEKDAFLDNLYESNTETEAKVETLSGAHYPKVNRPTVSLTNEELVFFIKNGVNSDEYKNKLVQYNTPLVYKIATSFYTNIPFDDKIQYGFLGLIEALESYDADMKVLFVTYASTIIQQHIRRYSNQHARLVDYPEKHAADAHKIKQFVVKYAQKHNGKEPTPQEISKELKLSISDIQRAQEQYSFTTFDSTIAGTTYTLSDIISDSYSDLTIESLYDDFDENIPSIVKSLHEQDQVLINKVHGLSGYEICTIDQIYKEGFCDKNGKEFKSAASLYRYYHTIAQSMKRIIKNLNLDIEEPRN